MRRALGSLLACAVVLGGSIATAAPKKPAAKKEFQRGVAAYTQGDYAAASAALARSFKLEADAETLFAWAQTERKLDHCDRALELYAKLMRMDLPDENKQAVTIQIDECNAIIAAAKPEPGPPPPAEPEPVQEPLKVTAAAEGRPWWKDPVGGGLVGVGLVGVGLGTVFLVQAHSADADKATAATYPEFEALDDKARSRGRLGILSLAAGGGFIAVGALWYATRKPSSSPTVTGWLAPTGGGIAVAGGF